MAPSQRRNDHSCNSGASLPKCRQLEHKRDKQTPPKPRNVLHTSIFLVSCALSWLGGHAFLLTPRRHNSHRVVLPPRLGPGPTNLHQVAPPLFLAASDGMSSDEEEWKAMLAAFQMYKAAYGNLKVPLRFTVPALPPWPG